MEKHKECRCGKALCKKHARNNNSCIHAEYICFNNSGTIQPELNNDKYKTETTQKGNSSNGEKLDNETKAEEEEPWMCKPCNAYPTEQTEPKDLSSQEYAHYHYYKDIKGEGHLTLHNGYPYDAANCKLCRMSRGQTIDEHNLQTHKGKKQSEERHSSTHKSTETNRVSK